MPAQVLARRSAATFVTAVAVMCLASASALAADATKRTVHTKAAATHAKRRHPAPRVPQKRTPPAAAVGASRPVVCTGVDVIPTPDNVAAVVATTLCLVDQQRAAAGLGPLTPSSALVTAAGGHSAEMVANDYFGHAAGMNENIAAATGSLAAPASIVAMWMNSPGHRANILDRGYRTTGIGVVAAVPSLLGDGGATYTEDFGPTP